MLRRAPCTHTGSLSWICVLYVKADGACPGGSHSPTSCWVFSLLLPTAAPWPLPLSTQGYNRLMGVELGVPTFCGCPPFPVRLWACVWRESRACGVLGWSKALAVSTACWQYHSTFRKQLCGVLPPTHDPGMMCVLAPRLQSFGVAHLLWVGWLAWRDDENPILIFCWVPQIM